MSEPDNNKNQDMPDNDSVAIGGHQWTVSRYDFLTHTWKRINPKDMVPGKTHRYDRVE
jgi:hypothetical protein